MIALKKTRNAVMGNVPRHLTTLSVSWLNNQFKAVAIHRGQVQTTWERAGLHDEPGQFEEFISEAVRETGYQGQTISLVLAHPRLVQQMMDVPPVKWSALQKVVQRQAQQQKFFSGEAAYASQSLAPAKGSQRVLLHLFPRLVLSQFMLAGKRNGLHLVSVLPVSVVLQRQLAALSLQKGDIVMLAAETGGSTTVVVGDGDGRLLLARTLQGTWNDDCAKLALDLNRTVLFTSQQFNITVNRGLHLFGPRAEEHVATVQKQVQLQVAVSPVPCEPFHWATEGLKVRPETAPNFLSPELQKAPQRRVFARVVAAGVTLLLAGSIALTAYATLQSRREEQTIANFSKQVSQIEARQKELEQLNAELQRKQQAIVLVLGERPPPKPAWLLAYLGQVVPPDLVITNFSVKRQADYYRVKLAGTYQQATKSPTAPPIARSVEALKVQMAGHPFHVRILETEASGQAVKPVEAASKPGSGGGSALTPLAEWLNRVTTAVGPKLGLQPRREEMDHFVIEGVVR